MALFEWAERVQRYESDGWAGYESELTQFLNGGMNDDTFIEATSRIFVRGCHLPKCSELDVHMADERKANFYVILNDVFGVNDIKITPSPNAVLSETPRPTPQPTPQPQSYVDQACRDEPNGLVSLEGCREYLKCNEGKVESREACPEGQLFDSSIGVCNWGFTVYTCKAPTPRPTPQPYDNMFTGPTGQSPQIQPQPEPFDPTIQYPADSTPRPTWQQQPWSDNSTPKPTRQAWQPPSGESFDQNGSSEKSNEPTHSETLIPLPGSGARMRRSFCAVLCVAGLQLYAGIII